MEARKPKGLRVRVSRIKVNSSAANSTPSKACAKKEKEDESPCTSKNCAPPKFSPTKSKRDDFATVHLKLAAALETAAANATGSSGADLIDWKSIKAAIIAEAEASSRKNTSSTCCAGSDADVCTREMDMDFSTDAGGVYFKTRRISDSSTSSSDEEVNISDLLLVSPYKYFENLDTERSTLLSKLQIADPIISVLNDENPTEALSKIFSLKPFDAQEPNLQVQLIIKSIVSLAELSLREDNVIQVNLNNSPVLDFAEVSHIQVKHSDDEFLTFCSCKNCLKYREIVIHIMVEQFKSAHMVVMLLDVLIKAYGPMLKNRTAYNKFEKLLDANTKVYWIACGFVYNKKAEHMDFIYDESLSDHIIFVLFSSILMVNNPLLLLQILAFHIECIVKAFAEGFLEIVEPDKNKIPAEEMLIYILDGYEDLCRISEKIASYLFAFENDFLRSFSLTWTLLCQRLYQQHVYANLTDTMLACIITLKEENLTAKHANLIKKYIRFDDRMNFVERRWIDIWQELNKFNLSEVERKRRKCLLCVHRIFDTIVQDAIAFGLQELDDDNDFYDFQCLENRALAWQNIMAYTKMKWPDGFFEPPNTLVCEDKCKKCNNMLEYHAENCKCITCSIAGGPLPPRRDPDQTCYKCLAQSSVVIDVTKIESKILNVCTNGEFLPSYKNNMKRESSTLEALGEEVCATMPSEVKSETTDQGQYHVAWAVFHHFHNRRRYRHSSIEAKHFCSNCKNPSCLLARKILNNEIDQSLSVHLVKFYQPLSMSLEDLRALLPNLMLYNRKMCAFNIGFNVSDIHDFVVKIYWTFIISLYATYFVEFDESIPLNLDYFEISDGDIKICTDKLIGNKEDANFFKFLDKIKSLSPFKSKVGSDFALTVDAHTDEIQNNIDELLKIEQKKRNSNINVKDPPLPALVELPPVPEEHPKKTNKEKPKKCCFDHSDLGEHCKENHSNKKRLKKECNHVRMNETRDRLRKKLSQLVNARKNLKAASTDQQNVIPDATVNTKQPPTLKSVAKIAAAAANSTANENTKLEDDDDSLVCLSTLCKRISHINSPTDHDKCTTPKKANIKSTNINSETPVKKSENNSSIQPGDTSKVSAATGSNKNHSNIVNGAEADKESGDMNDLNVYLNSCSKEFLDDDSRDQSKVRKWINETLSYIEGSGSNIGKKQPQPTNPKKAAKKAKQKLRKEEEKRIAELHDLRGQFHDIYFKEFTDKHKLKTLKLNKKRDKKQIGELEANIKKLQRAKAKVETVILELIATVKQTNSEFKFSYLPTKEQQVDKLKKIDDNTTNVAAANLGNNVLNILPQKLSNTDHTSSNDLNTATLTHTDYTLPYTHANVPCYSYPMDLVNGGSFGVIRPPIPPPMCYAPPQQQNLSAKVVAAMAANMPCNANIDPSKRMVTIRRVNLPNLPEPQVTVTARGSSPDKDKLLYTFVNGQLVPTTGCTAPMTQLPLPQTPLSLPMETHVGEISVENFIPPPPPPLSKKQMKKERKRLAKIAAAEAEGASEAEQMRQEQELCNVEVKSVVNDKSYTKLMKTKEKNIQKESKIASGNNVTQKQSSIKQKKKKSATPDSTITISTAEATKITKATKIIERRSASTTTSCSVETSLSITPVNSKVSTRENSLTNDQQHTSTCKSVTRKKNKQEKNESQNRSQVKDQMPQKKSNQKTANQSQQIETPKLGKNKKKSEVAQSEVKEKLEKKPTEVSGECRKERKARPHFVDNGQFDNNPYKSLHMQDSDSDWESSSAHDGDLKVNQHVQALPIKETSESVIKAKTMTKAAITMTTNHEEKVKASVLKSQSKKGHQDTRNSDAVSKKQSVSTMQKPHTAKQIQQQKKNDPLKTKSKLDIKGTSGSGRNNGSVQQELPPKSRRQTKVDDEQCKSQRNQVLRVKEDFSVGSGSTNKKSANAPSGSNRSERNSKTGSTNNTPYAAALRDVNRQVIEPSLCKSTEGKPLSKRAQKQAQRSKKLQKQQNLNTDDCSAGIPRNMGYFDPNDVLIPPSVSKNYQSEYQQQMSNLSQQMQGLNIGNNITQQDNFSPTYASVSNNYQKQMSTNISIMDQLNRGVQVENLSLPPGITLTKVDPIKSEQLRQKSESIRKLSKPLQSQSPISQSFHHPGATIIAPPVASSGSYYGTPYSGVVSASAMNQSGIIMVEANAAKPGTKKEPLNNIHIINNSTTAPTSGKTSKSKKRRNKAKQETQRSFAAGTSENSANASTTSKQQKMITLRNPMFHGGAASAAATILQQQPGLIAGRQLGGMPLAAPMPMDQPAAIIKNENGMFTIRNPALHQAVTSGLTMGGYRQFGNVSYYTPQEAAAEAVRATQQNVTAKENNNATLDGGNRAAPTFSYFSNSSPSNSTAPMVMSPSVSASNSIHNTISISCTSINDNGHDGVAGGGRLTGDAAVIARPSPSQKCISAIGSEIKSAQQQKQKCKENAWPRFSPELQSGLQLNAVPESLVRGSAPLPAYLHGAAHATGNSGSVVGSSGGCLTTASLQEKYQQSSYYNGFDVFQTSSSTNRISTPSGHSNSGSLFENSDCHLHHHNCGEDSPPPTITGYNSYLDGITHTGIIRYDDASFLKNLIPGQTLNNEVSIHNIKDSNFSRNTTSPAPHRVEITPVYGSRPTSTNIYEHVSSASQSTMEEKTNFIPNYGEGLTNFNTEATGMFTPNNLANLNEIDAGSAGTESDVESFQRFSYEFEPSSVETQHQQNVIIGLNELLINKSPTSQRSSPYLDDVAMDNFVQNIGALQISAPSEEKCGTNQLNGNNSASSGISNGSSTGPNSCTTSANGWW